ncbi:MAG: hypothetical protein WCS95_08770 [Lentisphaeria bacterium]
MRQQIFLILLLIGSFCLGQGTQISVSPALQDGKPLPATPNITVLPTPLAVPGKQTITVEVKNEPAPPAPPQLKVALFVQNHSVQAEYQQYMNACADMLGGALANLGLAVINPANVLGTTQNRGLEGELMPEASASALSAMLGADYFVSAVLRRVNSKKTGLRPETTFTRLVMGMTLSIAAGNSGVIFASQDLVLESPPQSAQMLENNLEDIFHNLLEDTLHNGAEWLMQKIAQRQSIPASEAVQVSAGFSCNVPGAFLEIDGVALGTISEPVHIKIAEGLHKMRVTHPYFLPLEMQAVFREGSRFDVVLEMSPEGYARWQDRESFLTVQKRILDSGASADYARRAMAEGSLEFLKESHFRWDGALQSLTVIPESQPPLIYGPIDNQAK